MIKKNDDSSTTMTPKEREDWLVSNGYIVGAEVMRGPDWEWEDQDGGGIGKIKGIAQISEGTWDWIDVLA